MNALAPGVVDTDMVRVPRPSSPGDQGTTAGRPVLTVEQQLESLARLHPLGRMGQAEEIAESALYLLRTPYVTGTILVADGGLSLAPGEP